MTRQVSHEADVIRFITLSVHNDNFLLQGRGRSAEVAAALGEDTLSLFPEAALSTSSASPRKKSKLSEKIAGKLR